jgi:restriction system protein
VAIPDFQALMRPLLEAYASGSERPISEVRHELGNQFNLTEGELAERLPSGLAKTFDNRVGWSATYLYRTGLLARPRRAVYAITERGRDVLAANPSRVDLSVLAQYPEFEESKRYLARHLYRVMQNSTPLTT